MPQPEMNPVVSGNLASWGYDSSTEELYIEFHSGGLYVYSGVPTDIAEGLREAPSKGQYHRDFIKGIYPYQRVS